MSASDEARPEAGSLGDELRTAENVLLGTVTGTARGFSGAQAGTLLRVRSDESLKGNHREEFFIFHPTGEVVVDGRRICQENEFWAPRPNVGDRVLVLFDDYWFNARSDLILAGPSSLLPLTSERLVQLPKYLRERDPAHHRAPLDQVLSRAGLRKGIEP